MDVFASLMGGFQTALQPLNLFVAFIGVLIGTVIGMLPGIGQSSAAKHATRIAALEGWLAALIDAIVHGTLTSHPPTAALLALHVPLVVRLQARVRAFIAVRRYAGLCGRSAAP